MDQRLIDALQNAACYDHDTSVFELIETHISWVLLTGPYAYKIKKPLNLGFLDFTSLESRRFYCQEELRLNRRLAPTLYCDVVAVTGTEDTPTIRSMAAAGRAPIEFAVKMRQFDQADRLDHVLERGKLTRGHIEQLARTLARFHQEVAVAPADSPFGTADRLYQPVQECFDQLGTLLEPSERPELDHLRSWCQQEFGRLGPLMARRKQEGFIRECHGDVHLANMILQDNEVTLFDCIEFSENLRWIDVMSEIAFVTMDLIDRKAVPFAFRLLNRYLAITGDYEGLDLLRVYQVYRALVRAKIAGIRSQQEGDSTNADAARRECRNYLQLARRLTEHAPPRLWITHGLSGTGKTALGEEVVAVTGAIQLRTDVERKRLFGLPFDAVSTDKQKLTLYGADMTSRVYRQMAALAETVLQAGFTVWVDGTFLKHGQRQLLVELAHKMNIPWRIVHLEAPTTLLQQRIDERRALRRDASEADTAVLRWQQSNREDLDQREESQCLHLRTDQEVDIKALTKKLLQ